MATAIEIARWIEQYATKDLGVSVDRMSLIKQVVYAQSFWLALNGEELFPEEVEAWRNGPVVPQVYKAYKPRRGSSITIGKSKRNMPLASEIESFLSQVVQFFGRYSALQLSNATHNEDPWRSARGDLPRSAPSHATMPKRALRVYYAELMADGEYLLSAQEMLGKVPEPQWGTCYIAGICARHLTSHPFYDWDLAERISRPVPAEYPPDDSLYRPLSDKDYVDLGDAPKLTASQILEHSRRMANAT